MHTYRSLGLCLTCSYLCNLLELYRVQKPYSWKQYRFTPDLIHSSHTHSRLPQFPTKHEIQHYQREMTHHKIGKCRNNKSFASGAKLPNTEVINSYAETSGMTAFHTCPPAVKSTGFSMGGSVALVCSDGTYLLNMAISWERQCLLPISTPPLIQERVYEYIDSI